MEYTKFVEGILPEKLDEFRKFIKNLNRREHHVRFLKTCNFNTYIPNDGVDHGYGFLVDGNAVPYFHPNRSFHDEIIWLNENLYYDNQATFEDRLINSAIVKFYGPSNTLNIITKDSGYPYIKYDLLINDGEYLLKLMQNIEFAFKNKEKIWGTSELRTSLQTESRNYSRSIGSPIDSLEGISENIRLVRKMRPSDMIFWFTYLGPKFIEFYKNKPDMPTSYNFLSSFRGIGNYYGYHFSSNLARMPEIGTLIKNDQIGNLSEDDDFIAAGTGAMDTLNWLLSDKNIKINNIKTAQKYLNMIRYNQDHFFDYKAEDDSLFIKEEVSELGYFTNFGCEISCCQFSVYRRLKDSKSMAANRAKAPISLENACIIKPKNNELF